jgi:hypothetical protein
MIKVKSSAVRDVDYDEASQVLTVAMTNGSTYTYADVPREHYRAMTNAESVGRYFNAHIRPTYAGAKQPQEEA